MKPTKSILSERAESNGGARAAGKIRCGTKLLTNEARGNRKAVEIYEEGIRSRRRASEIEKDLKALGISYPMYPTNTKHFNVSASDFVLPIFADKIIEEYGEGDGADRKLYKFPVMFHSDHLFDFFPHALESHKGDDKFRSNFDANGVRVCEVRRAVSPDQIKEQRSKGIKRVPPREWEVRGTCDPRSCAEFKSGLCQFRGRLLFYMPKISGLGLLSMETSSEYAAENIWTTLEQIREALGYIPKHNPNRPGQPVFWLSKVQEERTYYDEKNQRRTGLQWVPRLTADIDMGTLMALAHNPHGAPTVPKAWLVAPESSVDTSPATDPQQGATSQSEKVEATVPTHRLRAQIEALLGAIGCDKSLFVRYVASKYGSGWEEIEAHLKETLDALQKLLKYGKDLDVYLAAKLLPLDYGVPPDLLAAYAAALYGPHWGKSFPKMRELIAHLRELFADGHDTGISVMQAKCPEVSQVSMV